MVSYATPNGRKKAMANDYGIGKKWEETVLHAVEAARRRCVLTNPHTGNWDGEKTKRFNKHLSDEIKSRDWSILNDLGDDLLKEVSELVAEIKKPHETLLHKNQSEDNKQIEKVNGCLLDAMAMDVLRGALERFYIEEDKLKYAQDAVQKREEELKAEHAIREKELINIQELIDALKAKQGRKGTKKSPQARRRRSRAEDGVHEEAARRLR